MRPARWLLLIVAILAGGLAAFLATRGSDTPAPVIVTSDTGTTTTVVAAEPKTQILIANAPIGFGQRLSSDLVRWADWPQTAVQPEYIDIASDPEALDKISGAVARFEIFPGEPVSEQKLVRTAEGYLSAVLEKGMRGFSIPVTADTSAGGFIVPNDRVDVVLTDSSTTPPSSETVLRNVKVLAIGKRLGETGTTGATTTDGSTPAGEGFADATIATLELTPQQSEILSSAKARGTLNLALRSVSDTNTVDVVAEQQVQQPTGVRIIRGGNEVALSQFSGNNGGTATTTTTQIVTAPSPQALSQPLATSTPQPVPALE